MQMFVRPVNCHDCGNGFYALGHVIEYAQQQGQEIIDIAGGNANKAPVYAAIDSNNPTHFYGFGHGGNTRFTGDSEQDIFTVNECDKLAGKEVYLLSCLTANALGSAIIQNGATAYAGYRISWTWVSDSGSDGDPYQDLYAKGFYESANELWVALIDGKTFEEAVQAAIDKYNEWIDYWFDENPEAPQSQDAIMWLIHDRNGLVALYPGMVMETAVNWPMIIIGASIAIGLAYYVLKPAPILKRA